MFALKKPPQRLAQTIGSEVQARRGGFNSNGQEVVGKRPEFIAS